MLGPVSSLGTKQEVGGFLKKGGPYKYTEGSGRDCIRVFAETHGWQLKLEIALIKLLAS